jgi:hypothetical protein
MAEAADLQLHQELSVRHPAVTGTPETSNHNVITPRNYRKRQRRRSARGRQTARSATPIEKDAVRCVRSYHKAKQLCVERFGRVKERHSTHKAAAHAVAADRRHHPKLLFNLGGPHPILPWSSVEAEPSTAQAEVVWHRGGPPDPLDPRGCRCIDKQEPSVLPALREGDREG